MVPAPAAAPSASTPQVATGDGWLMPQAGVRSPGDADGLRDHLRTQRRYNILTLSEVVEAGLVMFGDPEAFSLYGMPPGQWYEQGARILGRTCVEACVDSSARRIASALTQSVRRGWPTERVAVADLFAGSANLMLHVARGLSAPAVGVENNLAVFAQTRANLHALGLGAASLRSGDWADYFGEQPDGIDVCVFIVAPPWGDAFTFSDGLDLSKTAPPVRRILDTIAERSRATTNLAAVQVPRYEAVTQQSLRELTERHPLRDEYQGILVFEVRA